ncbi:hypothetical protein D1872_299320 [compost metagenome]
MKLHKDGSIEGTPQEIAEYNKLTSDSYMIVAGTIDTRELEPMPTLKFSNYSNPADYLRGLMSAINSKGTVH